MQRYRSIKSLSLLSVFKTPQSGKIFNDEKNSFSFQKEYEKNEGITETLLEPTPLLQMLKS
jgi:hypothetical protein